MPLLDHFHPPLRSHRQWHGFHHAWATTIAFELNQHLPAGYFAEPNVQFGIEIDVAAFEETPVTVSLPAGAPDPAALPWTPPEPVQTLAISILTDVIEVAIFSESGGPTLAGAIELVSPSNKDRPAHRDAFGWKCASYIQQGLGLLVIDVVTERRADLHGELLSRLGSAEAREISRGATAGVVMDAEGLYAAAYHPIVRGGQPSLDVWHESLAIGRPLPTMPLWLRGRLCVPVALEEAYEGTCSKLRIDRRANRR